MMFEGLQICVEGLSSVHILCNTESEFIFRKNGAKLSNFSEIYVFVLTV